MSTICIDELSEIIGLGRLKEQIRRSVASCKIRHAQMGHVLVCGVGGCGKSKLGFTIAKMLGCPFYATEAADLKSRDAALNWIEYCNTCAGGPFVMFVDEIHRLGKVQEAFYYPMEAGYLNRDSQKVALHSFTMIGATTRRDMLDQGSFVTRFQNVWDISRYSLKDIECIVDKEFIRIGILCDASELCYISRRCLGIPRTAINLVNKVRDQILYAHPGRLVVDKEDVRTVFGLEEVDSIGLQKVHVLYLQSLAHNRDQAKGLGVLSVTLGRAKSIVEDTVEPILFALGFISATPRGRMLSERGLLHLQKQGLI